MGTYNGARFILDQLNSLRDQTYLPLELVICDDGSTDDTFAIVERFKATAPFPVHAQVNEKRLGYADNFLKASALCSGEIIAFCDQDDWWYPDKLQVCVDLFSSDQVMFCSHDADLCDSAGNIVGDHVTGVPTGIHPALSLKPWDIFFGFTCLFRRELLEAFDPASRPQDDRDGRVRMSHDGWFYFIGNSIGDTAYAAKRLVKYRQHDSNLYGSRDLTNFQKVKKLVYEYAPYLDKYRRLAQGRAEVLEHATPPAKFAARTAEARRYWQNLETHYADRLRIANASWFGSRAARIANLAAAGAYAPITKGGVGRRAMVEDVVASLWLALPIPKSRLATEPPR